MPQPVQHCLQIFFADMQTHVVWPMLFQKKQNGVRQLTKKEAAAQIRDVTCSLKVMGIQSQTSIGFYISPSLEGWVSEWAVLAYRCVAVIIPLDFTIDELVSTLEESKSRIVFVDSLAVARAIAQKADRLRYLKNIVCFEGGAGGIFPIVGWEYFVKAGRDLPDNLPTLISSIEDNDRALLFHYKDEAGAQHAINYTHALLLKHARKMDEIIAYQTVAERTAIEVNYKYQGIWRKVTNYSKAVKGDKSYIRKLDTVLAAVAWSHIVGHIMSYYVPVLKAASVKIYNDFTEVSLQESKPQVIIGETTYLDSIRTHITTELQRISVLHEVMLAKMLELGKHRYETTEQITLWQRMQNAMLRKRIQHKATELFGGGLRLVICVDGLTDYKTQLFFHTFGIEFVEISDVLLNAELQPLLQ